MLDLSNVTLVSIDSADDYHSKSNIRIAAISRIVPKLLEQIKFGDVLMINPFGKNKDLLNETFIPHWKDFIFDQNGKNIAWYSNYVIKKLPYLIKTDWYLIIQWDGFPIETGNWSNDFFEYHFLGGGHSVFNGGFSLRNTETMRKLAEINDVFETGSEDGYYSAFLDNEWSVNRKTPFKIKWAEQNIVNKFCFWDSKNPQNSSFGWHRLNYLSKHSIQYCYRALNIFSDNEILKLSSFCLLKEIDTDLDGMNLKLINTFDIDYNDEFFNSY